MKKFPHLKFQQKLVGAPRRNGGGRTHPVSQENIDNRNRHGENLTYRVSNLKRNWEESLKNRQVEDLPELNPEVIPVFLQINPDLITSEFELKQFNIEIISQEDDGFIVGASLDNLNALETKIQKFIDEERGGAKIADFWQIVEGNQWKPEHIASEYLLSRWSEIHNDEILKLEIGIAFDKPLGIEPDPTKRGGRARLENYRQKLVERDELLMNRHDHITDFIGHSGEITSSFIDLNDSFSCQISITGKGLKDLVYNYPFIFEVNEIELLENIANVENIIEDRIEIEILPPEPESPEIGVIDSGIMEGHRYLAAAINPLNSISYLNPDTSTADYVAGGGHGTRVAGAILYPNGLENIESPYQLPCFIRNIRVLDNNKSLNDCYPAGLMTRIVNENDDCKVFNLSINSTSPYRLKHMSSWAAAIDSLIHQKSVLFIISAGNISIDLIKYFINNGISYPDYLNEALCRLSNPAHSCFALTVGSINHITYEDDYFKSIGNEFEISPFSKSGTGIWGMIKPDVVEFGGGLTRTKNQPLLIKVNEQTSPELIRSTLEGGGAIGRDDVGTSYSTPKVSHIVSQLLKLYPTENINLLRALTIQGARLPENHFINPVSDSIKFYGYGLPSLERSTKNDDHRVTFYDTGSIKADEAQIYSLKIPESLRFPEEEFDILIEISLTFTADIRRTRQKTKSYLATWIDWTSSKIGESVNNFRDFILKEYNGVEIDDYEREARNAMNSWDWKIRGRSDAGNVADINRTNSSAQKDWTVLKSHDLPEEINFAIKGHKSWDVNQNEVPYAIAISIESLDSNIEVYESIRIENEIEIPIEV